MKLMFLEYYNLLEQPFGVTPDTRFLYLNHMYREALASLWYGIKEGRGFMVLVAQPGMGKTTLLFQLLQRLRSSLRTDSIPVPNVLHFGRSDPLFAARSRHPARLRSRFHAPTIERGACAGSQGRETIRIRDR